ncbi:MAG: hypothetical protein H6702_21305 [Myxococcales bacterium]|nr:hypothetical protein [Myxococcales bacterium]
MLRPAALSVALLLAACGDNPDQGDVPIQRGVTSATAATTTVAGLVAGKNPEVQAVIVLERMAAIMAAHKANCPNMGLALKNFIATNRPVLSQIKAAQTAQDTTLRDGRRQAIRKRLAAVMGRIVSDGLKCKGDAAVQEAMKSM